MLSLCLFVLNRIFNIQISILIKYFENIFEIELSAKEFAQQIVYIKE